MGYSEVRKPRSSMTKTSGLIDSQAGPSAVRTQRRSQAERSTETRTRVIDAAIQCLYEVGYSATTTGLVVSRAGVSRGAMTHQFPSKADLMEAVVSAVYEDELKEYERLTAASATREAYYGFPRLTWTILSRPSSMAVIEIMMASRSDPVLASRLRDQQQQIAMHARLMMNQFRAACGVEGEPLGGPAAMRIIIAAVRGLAIESLYHTDRQGIDEAVDVLGELMRLMFEGATKSAPS